MEDRTVFQPSAGGSVRPGVRLNGIYEIERLIAQGGMGEVYRGFNIQTRDPVAIKMIRPELSNNPDVFDLFRREASILHTLQHEAIVRYFVFSVDPDLRRAYLAMEFVDGPSLTTRLASGPLPLADVKILQKRIGSALDTAHRLGVVHRDISSDNVILLDGDVRSAKIIDFGIARSHRPGEGTIVGDGFAGKYNYVSPEQLGLAGGDVTFKSDIYSFGLVLAEALRGRPIDMSGSQAEIIEKRRTLPDLSDIDPSIRPLIQAMLQPLPANRPPSMAAVAAWEGPRKAGLVLPRAGAGKTAPAREPSGGRAAAILGALIAIVSVTGAAYVFRDDLMQWAQSVVGPSTPSGPPIAKLPPIGAPAPTVPTPEPTTQATTEAATPPSTPQATNPALAPPPAQHVPTSGELVDAMPPRAPRPSVDLPPATVGALYRAELPAFTDHGGKGLRLAADSPPEGMTFKDLGDGRSEIEGAPTRAGSAAMQIVATNHNGMTAQMTARIDISEKAQTAAQTAGPTPTNSAARPAQPAQPPPTPAPQPSPVSPPTEGAHTAANVRIEPPRPSLPLAVLEGATVGAEFSADLPQFNAGANAGRLALRAEPGPPNGLAFVDLGSGLSRLSGRPIAPGASSFDVVATDPAGGAGRMTVKLTVAPAPAPPPQSAPTAPPQPTPAPLPQVATAPPLQSPPAPAPPTAEPASPAPTQQASIDKAKAFVSGFDGGDCFLVKPMSGSADSHAYLAVGRDVQPFQRFDSAYASEVGAEPQLSLRLIAPSECPALDLIRLGTAEGASAPRIELANYSVGRGRPLTGTIANLDGRRLFLMLVGDDGVAHRLDAKPIPGRDAATFSVPLTPDASSIGPMQILLAIVSARPIPALVTFRSGPLNTIAAELVGEARGGSVSVEADFFKFVN